MERILETFRINKLLKRNTKTKGLQGKELKAFLNFVDGLKHAVLEDIVLVNKDNAESRMRRAGYLRYTNKTSYGIVEERFTDKDWKTGEKFASSSSDFSGAITPVHETSLLPRYVHFPCLRLTGLQRETPNSSVESIEEAVS